MLQTMALLQKDTYYYVFLANLRYLTYSMKFLVLQICVRKRAFFLWPNLLETIENLSILLKFV